MTTRRTKMIIAISPLNTELVGVSNILLKSIAILSYVNPTYRVVITKINVEDPYKSYPGFYILNEGKILSKYAHRSKK